MALKFKPPLLDTKSYLEYFRVADIASTFKKFADKFKDEIAYVGSLIALNLSRKLFSRNRAGGKASFCYF